MESRADDSKSVSTKVIQSGKVYRQKFDAEVQLVRALTETELKRKTRDPTYVASKEHTGIPLVKESRGLTGTGMLTGRQRTWIEGFPNESHQENPVLYKYYSEEKHQKTGLDSGDLQDVMGLPDVVSPAKKGSDIIERIAESRRQRHERAVEDMHQELGLLSSNLEPEIVESGEALVQRLADNDKDIEEIMARIEKDEDLMACTKRDLDRVWREVAEQSVIRQHWIRELDSALTGIEERRMNEVRQIFTNYSQQMEKIAHLMVPNLQRLLDHESQLINQTVLSNKRAYADLYARLMMSDIEREKKLHTQWRRRVDDWKKLHTEKAVNEFIEYMDSDPVQFPPAAQEIINNMKQEQEKLNAKRLELLETLRTFKPPASTKTAVYQWNQQLTDISKQIDKLNQEYFTTLCKQYENVCQDCLEKVDTIKADLMKRGVCSERRAQHVMNERCLPLVGQRQTSFEKELEAMDKCLEQHNAAVLHQLRSLFKYCQGAAHVWDVHELGLAKTERALQEKLDECRRKHDNDNQDKEANLDITMDRMRQDASEASLQESLKKAIDMLTKIKEGYHRFQEDQLTVVAGYPDMVEDELYRYDASLCKYFSISRENPEDAPKEPVEEKPPSPEPKGKQSKASQRKKKKAGSRPSSQVEERKESPVPQAVSEILSTAKGTTFYVLTVAGEHGVPADSQDTARETEREAEGATFVTEVQSQQPTEQEQLPDYVRNVDVPDTLLNDIKKMIRMNFLDQLEDWSSVAVDRSRSVVAAKTEELNSELDLRLHLHEPRCRRAELDVHNVRAAELVMHSERVVRHCKGINQALTDLKSKFNQMTLEHNKLAQKFRKDIESLETVFINATKSSKLIALSSQLQVEQEKYMDVIRASLRQFRQHLDDTLQMLRESNARFIKSFKVFSDGGNFCPEEIDEYRKKLEKMSHKIDSAEGFIMADLEGMESKRLDQAMKVSSEFEDRFKHHMVDLVFMEKIARWLTNTQVKIKAEVADSNSQAQKLAQFLSDLDRRIDACEKPNLDKEQVTPTQLNDSLLPIFEAFHGRSVYLNCLKEPVGKPGTPSGQGNAGLALRDMAATSMKRKMHFASLARAATSLNLFLNQNSDGSPSPPPRKIRLRSYALAVKYLVDWTKVGFTSEVNPISRANKQQPEDPSVGIIKNILKTQKSRLGIDVEAEETKETAPREASRERNVKGGKSRKATVTTTVLQVNGEPEHSESNREKSKSRMSHRSDAQSLHSKKSGKSASVSNTETPKRVTSGRSSRSTRSMRSAQSTTRSMFSKGKGIDKKYFVFGEFGEDGEEKHLLGRVKRILREALEGLLAASEIYYRQKGNRQVTRPQALQETFEQCTDIITQKLQSYFKQTDEYHNECLQELRRQLDTLEELVARVPPLVIKEFLSNSVQQARQAQEQLNSQFSQRIQAWDKTKREHKVLLRPGLGHPNEVGPLEELCEQEEQRRQDYLAGVDQQVKDLQGCAATEGQKFIEELAELTEVQLLQYDQLLTIDDVEKGRVPKVKHPISELQRRKNEGRALEDDEVKEKVPRGKKSWTGIPKNAIVNPNAEVSREQIIKEKASRRTKDGKKKEAPSHLTAPVNTSKNTLGHNAVVEARDMAYQEYKSVFGQTLEGIDSQKVEQLVAEERWTASWHTSVDKVKQLY